MLLKQYYLGCLSHASYLIADERTKTAVVVDPQRDVEQYVRDAEAGGYRIKHVFLTHFHADFLAGHIELRDRAGATIHLGRRAEAEFPFDRMGDGNSVSIPVPRPPKPYGLYSPPTSMRKYGYFPRAESHATHTTRTQNRSKLE